jgi:hypothetical protein
MALRSGGGMFPIVRPSPVNENCLIRFRKWCLNRLGSVGFHRQPESARPLTGWLMLEEL